MAAGMDLGSQKILEAEIARVAERLETQQRLLSETEHALSALAAAEENATWVVDALRRFDDVWDVLTPYNRGRLVRALVDKVVYDDASGAVEVHLAKLEDAA